MSYNTLWDSVEVSLAIPYNRILSELTDSPRFVRGENTYVTTGNKVVRRLGTLQLNTNASLPPGYRVDNIWPVETLDTPSIVYLVATVFNTATSYWEIWYQRQSAATIPWQSAGTYRSLNQSTQPHVASVSRGNLYIKGFPGISGDKLGTVIFNGTGGLVAVQPWGLLGPIVPATLANSAVGTVTTVGGISATSSSFTVNISAGTLPATPFVVQLDYEQIEVLNCTGTSGTCTFNTISRAFNGTVAAAHAQNDMVLERNWAATAHPITIDQGWQYAFAWKSITGQYSNRSPQQQNPDQLPSNTGPFFNQLPQITVQGQADTTNIPNIGIFRTTDGGGTWYLVQDITNTGAGNIVYTDNSLASASGNEDPLPDTTIDSNVVAPSLTDHSPPPTVLAPAITGVATPTLSSPIAWFQGRLWYGIGNVLFFSALEEIQTGVPEECFPSGLFGNFFRFQYPITNVASTPNSLYVFTTQATFVISGTNLATFAAQLILDNYGFPFGMQRAIASFQDTIVFLTHDYRIALISDSNQTPLILSDPVFTDFVDAINAGGLIDIKYFADLDKELLFVTAHNQNTPANSRQWVYDVKRSLRVSQSGAFGGYNHFWNLPWTYPSSAQLSSRTSESTTQRRLVFAGWDGNNTVFARIDPTYVTSTDWVPALLTPGGLQAGAVNFDIDIVFNLTRVPPGDHVNQRRVPMVTPVVYSISFERTAFSGDDDPSFYWFGDDLWTDPISVNVSDDPPRRPQSKGYKTMEFHIFNVAQRVAWELTKVDSGDRFELQNFIITFSPDQGA